MAKSTYFSDETKIKTVEAARKFNEKYGIKSSQTSGQLGTVYKRAKEYEISDEAAEQISGIRERLFGRIQAAGSGAQAEGRRLQAGGDGGAGSSWDGILINRKDARTAAKQTGSTMPAEDAALAQARQGTLNARRAAAMGVSTMPGADAALAMTQAQAAGSRPQAEGDGRTRQAHGNVNYNVTGQLLQRPNAAGSMAAQNDARAMPAADAALAQAEGRRQEAEGRRGRENDRPNAAIAADPALAETLSGSGKDAYGIKAINQQVVQLTQQAEALKQERDNWDLQLAMGNITELPEEYYDVSDKLYRAQTGLKAAQFSADMARRVYQYTNAEPVQPDESIRDGDYRYINGFTDYDSADIDDPEAQQGVVYDYMTAEQVNVYNAIYQNEGRQEAERYLLGIKPQLQELQREAIARKMTELCREDKFAAAMLALSTVPAYVASAAGFADLAVKKLRQDLTGIPVNRGGLGGARNYTKTVNQAVEANIESKAGKKLYSGTMAMVNRAAVIGLSLLGIPTAALMALEGATEAANAALDQGASADEALGYGAIVGMVNQIIYAAPISALNTQDLSAMKQVLPQVLKNMALSGASSGTRMLASAVADEAAELILLADKADIIQRTQLLTLQGMTPDKASRKAWSEWAGNTLVQTAGAAAAGSMMYVVQSIPQIRDTVQLRREYQKLGDIPLNDLTRAWAAYYLQREDTPEQVKRMAGELYRMANGDLEGEVTLETLQQFTTYAADSAGAISLEDYDNIIRAARVIRDIGQAGAEQTGDGETALTAQTTPGQTEQNTAAIKALLLTAGEIEAGDYSPELQAQAAAVTEAIENGQAITPEWSGQFYQAISAEEQDFNTRVLPKILEQAVGRRQEAEGRSGRENGEIGRRPEAVGDESTGLQQESRESTIGSRTEAVGDEENDRPQAEGRRPKRTRETIDRRPEAVGDTETITKGAGANAGQIAGQPQQQQAGGQDRPGGENGRGGRILAGGLEGSGDRILGSRTGEYQQAKGASLFRLAGSTARVTPQSPAELGVKGGSTVPTMKVLPRDMIADMAAKGSVEFGLLQDITDDAAASGIGVEFFTGRGTLADGGSFDAMIVDDGQGNYRMMIDCGQSTKTPLQHYRHERFHYGMKQNRGRLMEMANEIARNGDTEALRKVMNTYWEKYDKPYGLSEMARSGNGREAWNLVIEEVMADAYAGLNKFGVKAGDLYGETVRGMMGEQAEGRRPQAAGKIGSRQEAEGRRGRENGEIGRRQEAEGRRGREDEEIGSRQEAEEEERENGEIGSRQEAEGRRTETGAQRMAAALEKDAETKRAKRELKQAMQELAQQAPKDTLNEMLQLARGYQGRNAEAVSALRDTVDMLNTDDANAIYAALSGSGDKTAKWLMKYMENKGAGDLVYDESLGENGFPRDAYMQVWRKEPQAEGRREIGSRQEAEGRRGREDEEIDSRPQAEEEEREEDFLTSRYSVAGPYTAGTENELAWRETLTDEARKTYETLRAIHMEGMQNKATMTVGNVGREHDAKVDIVRRFMTAQRWNEEIKNRKEFARTAAGLARLLPEDVRIRANINPDGTIDPTELEKAFKMERSFAQRIVDSLPLTVQGNTMELDGKTIQLSRKDRIYVPGGEAYRRELIKLKRDLYDKGQLRKKSLGGMSKDTWGTMGFLAVNGKTGASGDFTTLCPQMFYNKGCWYCYRRAALESGVNNKLTAETVWYTGEILQMRQEDIDRLNRNGGLRIQSFGDWMDQYAPMLADMLSDAEKVGLQVKIITKEPAMVETVALLREQGLGLNLYFNISADYTVERAGEDNGYTTAMNPARPFARLDGEMYWKRALSVEEAAKLREKYPWVNVRIVATNVDEFISGLQNPSVDVVTGYHGKIREMDRISSATGQRLKEVEPLGDSGMPVFARNPRNGQWITEYEGKTKVHKKLARAIEEAGLQEEYYTKTCCITGRCATCNGKCGKLSREFETKNATNRDGESVGYWAWWKDTMQQVDDGEDGPNVRWSLSDGDDVNDAVEETVLALSGAEDIRYAIGNDSGDVNEIPPQNRTADVGRRGQKLYAQVHPELRPYIKKGAELLQAELERGIRAETWMIDNYKNAKAGNEDQYIFGGMKREQAEPIVRLLDQYHIKYAEIEKALDDIVNDRWDEKGFNRAATRSVEVVIDDMLRNGYDSLYGDIPESNFDQGYVNTLEAAKRGMTRDEYWDYVDNEQRFYTAGIDADRDAWEASAPEVRRLRDNAEAAVREEIISEAVLDGKASDDQIDAWLREINAMQESDNEWIAAQERMQREAEGRRTQETETGFDSAEDALGQIVAGYDALAIERAANRAGGEELTEEQYADAAARQQSLDDWLYGMNAWEEEDVNRRIQRNLDNAIGAQRFTDEELEAGNADDAADWLNAVVAEENRRQRAEATIAEAAKAGNLPEELTDGKTGGLTEEQILKWAEERDKRNSLNTEALLKKYRGEGMTLDEALAAAKAEQERARLAALENVPRERMQGGPAMQSLGIRISGPAGSLNMYEGIDTIREQVKQNERMLKDLGRQIRKLHPSQEEETWAALISRGEADIDSLPRHMNSDRVEELADLISAQNASAVDILARQKAELRARNNELARERFKGAERANRVKIQRLNLNQPARNMEMMFGEKQGQEIYGSYFRPVRENEAEKIRKYNELIKPANEFTDGKGKQRALTEAEALITHKVMEAAPAAADLKNLTDEERDRIQAEAERLLRTEEDEEKKYRLRNRKDEEEKDDGTEEPEQAEKLTFDERRIATAVAQGKIAEEALRTGTYNGEEIDGTIIQEAAKYFRDTYDKMYDALTELFIAHGEEPPGFVKGYAPHHQSRNANGILSGIMEMVNSGGEIKDLPASIAGRTHTWKPNKRWDPYFLHRSWGQELEFNAVEGFSDYIDHALDIFYHWDDILRLREASKHLRQEFLNEESRNELQGIDDIRQGDYFEKMQFLKAKGRIYANQTLIGREIDAALDAYADSLYKTADNANAVQSSLVMWWDNYTNLLAGKQSATDRGLEQRIGRAEMNALNKAMNTMAGSNVFGSFSSAVNQLSQIPLIQATFKQKNIVKALADICKPNSFGRWAADCDFLVEREGTDLLGIDTKTKVDKVLSSPMRAVDMFTAKLIARTAYLEGLDKGMTEEEAMQFANDTGERMQGSRAKGSKPNLFGTKEMVPRLLTTFQLEASNSFRYMVNDMPAAIKRDYRAAYQAAYDEEYQKKTEAGSDIPTARAAAEAAGRRAGAGKAAPKAAKMFLGYMIGAAAMNAICEALFGVKPAPLDMIGISAEFVAGGYGFTASEGTLRLLDALAGAMGAEGLQETIQKAENRNFDTMRAKNFDGWKLSSAMDAAEYDALKSIPFLSNVAGLVGWTNPMTDTAQNTFVGDAVKGAAQNTKYAVDEFKEGKILPGLRDLWYALTYSGAVKYAGRQARKTTQGAELVAKRGSYSYKGQLQYPLDVNVGNTAQAILFGRSANRQSRDYYAAGATPLSDKNTAMYEKLVEGGMDMYDAYQFVWQYQGIIGDKDADGETISGTELAKKAEALMTQAGAEAADIYLHMTDGKGENILSEAAYQRYERGKIEKTGMSLAEYMIAYGNMSSITGDKGEDGKTISGTSMLNKLRWMEQNLTPEETEAIILIPDAEGQSEFSGTGVKKWKKSGLSCSVTDYVAAYAYSCGLSGTKEDKKKKEEKKEELQSWLVFNRDLSAAEADAIAESVLNK